MKPNEDYPILDVIEDVAFIGLDSNEGELGPTDRFWSNGEIGPTQLKKLTEMLESQKVTDCSKKVVYLHHHPFDPIPTHQLKDADKLGEVFEEYPIDVLLFGHLHHGRRWNGWKDISRVYDAGATTMKGGAPGYHRVIDLERDARWDYDAILHGNYGSLGKLSLTQALLDLLAGR